MKMNDLTNFSLLYPSPESAAAHYAGSDTPDISLYELEQLGLLDNNRLIIEAEARRKGVS